MGWLKDLFWFKKPSPEQLHRRREAQEFIEAARRSAIVFHGPHRMENLGLSEYGAQKMLEEGGAPHSWEKVLLKNGDLITWEEWKERNQ